MIDARAKLEAAYRNTKRRGEVDLWLGAASKDKSDLFHVYIDQFRAMRQDNRDKGQRGVGYGRLRELIEADCGLSVCQNTLMCWIRKQWPDDPSLRD